MDRRDFYDRRSKTYMACNVYKIADLNGEEIKGSFYEPELQKTSQQLFRIEKVIKRGKKKSLVKWKGYSDDFNSWVDNKDIVNLC